MMGNVSALICFLLLSARGEVCAAQSERPLPQWLSGIISVSSFLLLVFIGFLVKKIWCNVSETSLGRSVESGAMQDDRCERDLEVFQNKQSGDVTNDTVARGGTTNVHDKSLAAVRGWSQDERETVVDSVYEMSLDVLRAENNSNASTNVLCVTPWDKSTAM